MVAVLTAEWERRLCEATSEDDARPVVAEIARALPDKADERRRRLADLVRRRKAAGWATVEQSTPESASSAPTEPTLGQVTVAGPPRDLMCDGRLTFEQYAAVDAVNWSKLKELRRSPLHYAYALENEREDSDTLAVGRGAHAAILEPSRFKTEFVAWSGGTRRGDEWEAFKAAHARQTILKEADLERCQAIGDAVRAHPLAAPYLDGLRAEQSIFWTDPKTGIKCKARLDGVNPTIGCGGGCIVELKTARDIEARVFQAAAHRLGYHGQLGHYQRGWAETHQGLVLPPVLIAVEALPPHDVAVYLPNEEMLLAGAEECDQLLAKLAECQRTGQWPGRYVEPVEMQLPAWAFDNLGGMEVTVDSAPAE